MSSSNDGYAAGYQAGRRDERDRIQAAAHLAARASGAAMSDPRPGEPGYDAQRAALLADLEATPTQPKNRPAKATVGLRSRLEVLLVSLRGPEPGGQGGRRGELIRQHRQAHLLGGPDAARITGQLLELGHIAGELAALLKQEGE